uniref:Uncharacterized protein isoform X2 n=1 Tax=Pogona vitticeps TaxID=103695 RepID=A0ABM5F9G4_9SAUR
MSKRSPGGSIQRGDPAPTARPGPSRMEGEPPVKNERLDGEGVSGQPGPSPPPAASAPAPDPPEERPRPESGGGGCGDGGRRPSDPEGPGGAPFAQGTSSPATGDPAVREAGAAAAKPGGTPDREREAPPAMGGRCSGSVAPEVLKQEEGFPPLSAENEQLKLQNGEKEEQVSRLLQAVQELKAQVSRLSAEKEQQKQQNQEKEEETSRLLQELKREVSHLQQQNQKKDEQISHLQHKVQKLEEQVSPLQQEVQELKKSPGASGAQQTTRWISPFGGPTLPVKVQIRITGKTGGSEEKFLNCVSEHLSHKGVSLKVEKFKETSKDPLLLFCPIASRMGADIENALEGLSGEQKVLLVVMHFVQKDNPGTSVDAEYQVSHPAVVRTVHTRYTLKDGFYPCEMNEVAVANVAAALKALAEDQ